ncbi:MAG TPA: AAA family ATPase [Nocardioides sp.]|nr:AAA family ATPase [Nocardioides sp.]
MAPGAEKDVVGRGPELAAVRTALLEAEQGSSRALVVTGGTGVGKTALVEAALAEQQTTVVLAGLCLPLQQLSVPLLPLRSALRAAAPPGHEACLATMETTDQAPRALDSYLDDLTAAGPVVLVVDDLQWADRSTLDLLLYLVAGPADRPLCLVLVARDDVLPDGHPLHGWLADVLRLPRVRRLRLGPLDRGSTETQIAAVLGGVPHQSLVDDVFARAGGNPYATHLMVRGLPLTARALPGDLPADLTAAVKRDWHQLGETARNVTGLVAVAGGPVAIDVLVAVAGDLRIDGVLPALEEAVVRRVLRLEDPDRYWFHHPLQAEVLEADLAAARRRAWHEAYARVLESGTTRAETSLSTAMALSDHHDRAGNAAAAYSWAMRSWEAAGAARGSPELRRLLRRAIELRPRVPEAAESPEELLELLRATAEAAGAFDEQLVAVDFLLESVDEQELPLLAGWLRVQRSRLQTLTGAGTPTPADARVAVELTAAVPTSWQHAYALAEQARTAAWAADPAADEHARRAVDVARADGHPGALAFALSTRAMASLMQGDPAAVPSYVQEASSVALQAHDWHGFVYATSWEINAALPAASEAVAELLRRRREALTAADAPHVFVAMLAGYEAEARLLIGDWRACRDLLRISQGSDLGAFVDIRTRLTAALLDALQGRTTQAEMQIERATELLTGTGGRASLPLPTVRTLVALADGRPDQAVQAALDGARAPGVPPHLGEWLLPLAARALADLSESNGAGRSMDEDVDALVREFPQILPDSGLDDAQVQAMQAWYDAEVARTRRSGDSGPQWWDVAEASEASRLPWVAVYAWWRAAESLLSQGPTQRRSGIDAWRRADTMARDLDATPILDEIATLGRIARVERPRDVAEPEAAADALPGLTRREREILAHVVAGSTYADIAAALVISEKTVSSHVSNLLRKTGTSGRVELSRLVTRLSGPGGPGASG